MQQQNESESKKSKVSYAYLNPSVCLGRPFPIYEFEYIPEANITVLQAEDMIRQFKDKWMIYDNVKDRFPSKSEMLDMYDKKYDELYRILRCSVNLQEIREKLDEQQKMYRENQQMKKSESLTKLKRNDNIPIDYYSLGFCQREFTGLYCPSHKLCGYSHNYARFHNLHLEQLKKNKFYKDIGWFEYINPVPECNDESYPGNTQIKFHGFCCDLFSSCGNKKCDAGDKCIYSHDVEKFIHTVWMK